MTKYQVVIVGGGVTGAGILRDLSMRGISTLLLEQGDLAHGTSSRFHGLLHSGARYVVKDPESAVECIKENYILKKIANHCISDTRGWFVQTKVDPPEYIQQWLEGCRKTQIPVKEIPLAEALAKEPLMDKNVQRVFEVPDAAVDGFKLIWANVKSAKEYGGEYKTYHQVKKLILDNKRVAGVVVNNLLTGEELEIHCDMVINAAGGWAPYIAATAQIPLKVICDKGTLLAFNQRLCQRIINRLRPSDDGDILVPHETITILGTTSKIVDSPIENNPEEAEVKKLLEIGEDVIPTIKHCRIIRAFSGVRPLYQDAPLDSSEKKGRNVSRSFALIDHQLENGIDGFISIVGGKFTTYRLMAEKVSDMVAKKLGNTVPCRTASENLLPQFSKDIEKKAYQLLPNVPTEKMLQRLGGDAESLLKVIEKDPSKGQLLCECEMVTVAEVEKIAADDDTYNLADIRRKTRLGMGTCQGAFCAFRALPLLWKNKDKYDFLQELKTFLNQRWKGIRPVLWGEQLRETELTKAIYSSTLQIKE